MKLLTVLSVLQFTVILALLLKVFSLDQSLTAVTPYQSAAAEPRPANLAVVDNESVASEPVPQIDPALLRSIVREEVVAALVPFSAEALSQPSLSVASGANDDSPQNHVYQYELEMLEDELDYYISQGSISDLEMSALQLQLVRLDQYGRKQIMQKLVRALNSGELSGRL